MKKMLFVLAIALMSCDARNKVEISKMAALAAPPSASEKEPEANLSRPNVITTADYRFQVEDVGKTTKNIQAAVARHQATIADMNEVTTGSERSNTFTIRVPAANFSVLMDDLGKDAVFTNHKKISTQDVTDEFVDINIRLKTKKEVRDRYIDILRNKAKTVEDVLKAEEQIRVLQEEIESKEGRLKYLQDRVVLSTINLEIYQLVDYREIPGTAEKPYIVKVRQGFANGWAIVTTLALVMANIWPLVLIGAIFFWRRHWILERLTKKS